MLIIRNQFDLNELKLRKNIDPDLVGYVEEYFNTFARKVGEMSPQGLSVEKCGVIVVAENTDSDFSKLVYLPNILKSIPEEVKVTKVGEGGNQREILHGLFLTNNEFGVDLIVLRDDMNGELAERLEGELQDNNL